MERGAYDSKHDAMTDAFRVAKDNGYCFVIQVPEGWTTSTRKPSLRYGKVFECRDDGKEYIA